MNACSWWNGFASPLAIASGCAGSRVPYAYVESARVDSHSEQVATNDGGRPNPEAHVRPGATTTLASALALVRRNRMNWLTRGRPSVERGDRPGVLDGTLLRQIGREPRPRAVRAQRLQAGVPTRRQLRGERMISEEGVDRVVVLPERDEPDPTQLRSREHRTTQWCRQRDVGVPQPGDRTPRRDLAVEKERRGHSDVGQMH